MPDSRARGSQAQAETANYPTPAGPPQGGYGYPGPAEQPQGHAYLASPHGQMPPVEDPARPKPINLAFGFLIASAVLGLISLHIAIAYMNSQEYLEYLERVARGLGL